MSLIEKRKKRKKGKYPRNRISRKVLHRQRIKRKIIKSRGWKLEYPEIFELSDEYPYIVRRKDQ